MNLDWMILLFLVLCTVNLGQGIPPGLNMEKWANGVDICARVCCNLSGPSRILSYSHEDKGCVCKNFKTNHITYNQSLSFPVGRTSKFRQCQRTLINFQRINKIKWENAVELCALQCCNLPNYSIISWYSYNEMECTCEDKMGKTSHRASPFFPIEALPQWKKCPKENGLSQRIFDIKHHNFADLCYSKCCSLSVDSTISDFDHELSKCSCQDATSGQVTFSQSPFFPIIQASKWAKQCKIESSVFAAINKFLGEQNSPKK